MARAGLVSVVVPAWNAAGWLAETLNSALAQTWRDVEVVVVDDGSTDETENVLRRYGGRVRYFRQDNAGQGAARNRGAAESDGEFIAFLDSDDTWLPEKIEAQVALMRAEPAAALAFCNYNAFGDNAGKPGFDRAPILAGLPSRAVGEFGRVILATDLVTPILDDMYCQVPSFWLVRRALFDRVGGFDPSLREGGEDWLLAAKLALQGSFVYDLRRLGYRREWPGSHSRSISWQRGLARAMATLGSNPDLPAAVSSAIARRVATMHYHLGVQALLEGAVPRKYFVVAWKNCHALPWPQRWNMRLRAIAGLALSGLPVRTLRKLPILGNVR